ncbi:Mov34/MPN/PAD-1 family protein [Shinella sp.]|uniref:Mov34/MPN/PAD-1 family protein n=1 Tax=Shinella sp. TaxID=1870904 RepID=UPI002897474A|nr:Mov34/MPN/PAD-1 family protein [Shinella sp.]
MNVEVILNLPIIDRMKTSLHRAADREIGGVLMARQIVPGCFEIIDFSVDELTGEPAHFVRDPALHNSFLDEFFERTGRDYENCNYIGEWHSHPRLPVIPSITDLGSMENLVNGERNIPFAVLLVVRSDIPPEFVATATFHHRGAPPAPARISFKNRRHS